MVFTAVLVLDYSKIKYGEADILVETDILDKKDILGQTDITLFKNAEYFSISENSSKFPLTF